MNKTITPVSVVSQRCIAPGFYLLALDVPDVFRQSAPGQFVMLRFVDNASIFLPRPLSIHSVYGHHGRVVLELLYQVVGEGTRLLSKLQKGDRIQVHGPLGRGFDLDIQIRRIVLVAGGMGIAPIRYLAEAVNRQAGCEIICYHGARCADVLLANEDIKPLCGSYHVATDDGSAGYHGFVTDLLARDLDTYDDETSVVCACGPHPMLKSLARVVRGRKVRCQVSIEERMACGVGACLGCAVMTAGGIYKAVCKDGPVFNMDELVW